MNAESRPNEEPLYNDFPQDPDNPGWVKGWAVYRLEPWNLVRLFESEKAATDHLFGIGGDHNVALGSLQLGTDNFVFSRDEN